MILKRVWSVTGCLFSSLLILAVTGCATDQGAKQAEPAQEQAPAAVVVPLSRGYSDIIVFEPETTPVLKKDYDYAIKECQDVLISSLKTKNRYKRVEPGNSGRTYNGKSALLVRIKISDMRIASGAARFWGGALAGSSYMNMRMKLVDAATQNVVREEDFNSTNNAYAAAWNFGASDRSLPSDMGRIMAEYIAKAVPAI